MEGYSSYPPPGGYQNNQRSNSFQYQNQYQPPTPSTPNPPSQQPLPQLYQTQGAAQQYTHQAYQPPTRQLRSYNATMNAYNPQQPAAAPPPPPPPPQQQYGQAPALQQPFPGSYQQPLYQPPPHPMAAAPQSLAQVEPETPSRASKPVPQVNIKTKFPVARIKRIMQADEDVGKVAQVTPVIVSKALELFMVSLVTKAAEQAKVRGSKRITAAHLKLAVNQEEQFDFLSDIISKAPDIPTAGEGSGSGKAAASSNSGGEFAQGQANMNNIIEEDGAAPKKGRRGRKKKVSSDDEDF
ncbi:hypothetical protein H072_7900 [Dactylellina haptotyla CBS 200.50]|uniref:NCT transcriptional regulatory complex subunit A n=1 Tax=Dactylellina haptotyla (strain CBS 200.50) TaxID=1284197 RepID=S8A5X0_DACHA|nr:hypothetical protein H072_7900 [Dactylellina haptotyla CBS 200.50]